MEPGSQRWLEGMGAAPFVAPFVVALGLMAGVDVEEEKLGGGGELWHSAQPAHASHRAALYTRGAGGGLDQPLLAVDRRPLCYIRSTVSHAVYIR